MPDHLNTQRSTRNASTPQRLNAQRSTIRGAVGLAFLLLAAGCPNGDGNHSSDGGELAFAGVEVAVVVPVGYGIRDFWTAAFEDWASAAGASYRLEEVEFESPDWRDRLDGHQPALVLLPHRLIPQLVADSLIAPIPPEVRTSELLGWFDLFAGVRERLTAVGSQPSILPVTTESLVCYFRADLLEAADRPVPETWQDYRELLISLGEWAPGMTAVEPWGPEFRATMLLARALAGAKHPAQHSVELDVSTAAPLINTEPFVATLAEFLELRSHFAEDVASLTPEDCRRALLEGRAAMGIAYEPPRHGVQTPGVSKDIGSFDTRDGAVRLICAPLPGRADVFNRDTGAWEVPHGGDINRPAVCGFRGLSVCVLSSASERQQRAAWDLWTVLQSFQADGTIPPLPGTPSRQSLLRDKPVPPTSELTPAEWNSYRQAVTANLQNSLLVPELPCAQREELRAALSDALDAALAGDASAQRCLDAAKDAWQRVIAEAGSKRVLNSYRACLGLTPTR